MSADNFTGQNISSTFQRLLQLSDNGNYITNGTGSVVQLIAVTSSYAVTASYVAGVTSPVTPGGPNTSIQFNSGGYFSGSSKLLWAEDNDQLILTPSYGDQLVLGFNQVAGYDVGVFNSGDGIIAAFDGSGSSPTFRYSNNNYKFDGNVFTHQFTGSVVAPNITGSLLGTASYALTASYVAGVTVFNTGSFLVTASVNLNTITFTKGNNSQFSLIIDTGSNSGGSESDPIFTAKSASLATTGSNAFKGNQTITGSITFNEGARITSTYYGNTYPGYIDIIAGAKDGFVELLSYDASSSFYLDNYGVYITTNSSSLFNLWEFRNDGRLLAPRGIQAPSFTGSLFGTASWAINFISSSNYVLNIQTSSFVTNNQTSSFVQNNQTSSMLAPYVLNSSTGSFATTGSNIFYGNQKIVGDVEITGSLIHGLAGNIATGEYSHAEGSITKATGEYSHAEGDNTQAKGNYSHAEGQETIASGSYSHAEGYQTIALANHQHVQGQFNAISSVPSAFIVGNGTDNNNRSNLIHAAGNEVQISGSFSLASYGSTPPVDPPSKVGLFYFTDTDLYISLQ